MGFFFGMYQGKDFLGTNSKLTPRVSKPTSHLGTKMSRLVYAITG